eukprot:TRINITY_DN3474_c1_g3_i1.p4 TRINITY_DN3474_c1_g3~~TRINITY_DN3474_c1_g3_i1.p4  ORF type:complete len:111 (-),score=6.62 TRINITY_DN3474_c1_g3_i1:163-495(-)
MPLPGGARATSIAAGDTFTMIVAGGPPMSFPAPCGTQVPTTGPQPTTHPRLTTGTTGSTAAAATTSSIPTPSCSPTTGVDLPDQGRRHVPSRSYGQSNTWQLQFQCFGHA